LTNFFGHQVKVSSVYIQFSQLPIPFFATKDVFFLSIFPLTSVHYYADIGAANFIIDI